MRGICVKSLFIVCLSSVLARGPNDPAEYSYTVDCSMAQYDYVDAGRPLNATYAAQTRSECITNCQSLCGSNPMPTLDCMQKNDKLAGCSFLVKKTIYTTARFDCAFDTPNGISLGVYAYDIESSFPIPISYAVNVSGYNLSPDVTYTGVAIDYQQEGPQVCSGENPNAKIPVVCDNGVCDITDVITKYKYYPDLMMRDSSKIDFTVSIVRSGDDYKTTQNSYTCATFMSAGMVPAIASTCSAHDNCNDCAAAKCNWCDNKEGKFTQAGYEGCGVSHEACEDTGYPFNNCDAYPKSGAMKSTGVISLAGLIVMAVLGFTM